LAAASAHKRFSLTTGSRNLPQKQEPELRKAGGWACPPRRIEAPFTLLLIGYGIKMCVAGPEIGSCVAAIRVPNASETEIPEYVACSRNKLWPDGQLKLPWSGGPTVREAVVWPFLTGNVPFTVREVDTVSLFPALGWLPPLFQHWYVAEAVSTLTVMVTLVVPVPSPASLKLTVSAPLELTVVLAYRKCGLSAIATTASASNNIEGKPKRSSIFFIFFS